MAKKKYEVEKKEVKAVEINIVVSPASSNNDYQKHAKFAKFNKPQGEK